MKVKTPIPKAKELDSTLSLINEGFDFLPSRRKELKSDIFETRLLGQKAVCIAGEKAAAVFYDNKYFKRKGAAPKPLKKTLFGEGGVHVRDGEDHHHQKRMFLSMMTPERLEEVKRMAIQELDAKVDQWETQDEVILLDELEEVLSRAVMHWAGLPFKESDVKQRTQELVAMVDSFGGSVNRLKEGAKARKSHEEWLEGIIKEIRSGVYNPPPYTAAYIVAHQKTPEGKLLDLHTAAVDLNNAYRPMIATAYLIVFGAMALHQYPETKAKMQADEDNYSHMFAQEVRRYYPFAPAMAAKVKKDFVWHGYHFKKNMLVILDLYGTNRHPDSWDRPEEFVPERFQNWKGSPFSFIPQGGGDHHMGHRCAGEWMTVMVMQSFFKYLATNIRYTVPDQDLTYDMARMPTMPKSHFVIRDVQKLRARPDNVLFHEQSQTVVQSRVH
ncbi:cytochrome P450 [Planococcus salinus]|uniref:Cytochrome P450 n=1 Tax=Planococcus salinus TaxID=1848460 RepID=A0A3M8P600_9BACL|nr:cytochrome P450 [Planococcus salinus]RNF38710.1 cytochrome P450 [Planococcus salinus]